MTTERGPTVADVQQFWDANPLWTGESAIETGTLAFFEEHRRVYHADCFAGTLDESIFPSDRSAKVLDLGCGIGFWLVEFWERGFRDVTGADLSQRSLAIAGRRCDLYSARIALRQENAEQLSFGDGEFDHVNCQGVIHHTPDTERCVAEIARVLRPGGTASISVYYRNFALRNWNYFRPFGQLAARAGSKLKGRGREGIFAEDNPDEIVRLYDGSGNPIGKSYTSAGFRKMVAPYLAVDQEFYHFFPARSLPVRIPRPFHRYLDRNLPFMIYLNLRKR